MIILTMFAVLLLLLSINVPIAIGLAVTTIIAMVLKTGTSFLIDTAIVMFDGSMKFPLIAIPLFILAGSSDERNFHLRSLMAIAQIVREANFYKNWMWMRDEESLRMLILSSTRKREL